MPIRPTKLCSLINPAFTSGSVSCTNNCTYNTSACTGNGGGHCGSPYIIEKGEQCEDSNLDGRTCATFNFTNGTLACNSNTCQFNTSRCNNPPPWCGDGKKNGVGESCDGTDLGGKGCSNYSAPPQFNGGTLTCTGDCNWDTSACEPIAPVTCHNGQMDAGEECDDGILNGQACPYGGTLRCSNCKLNYSSCASDPNHCGDGDVDPCEQCDEGPLGGPVSLSCYAFNPVFTPNRGRLSCNRDCTYNTSLCWGATGGVCGDPGVLVVAQGEQCEDSDVNGRTCSNFGTFTTGSLTCNASSCKFNTCHCGGVPGHCGDNAKNNASESCDGPDLDGQECTDLGFASGMLDCFANCHFNTNGCVPFPPLCGNGAIDGNAGEECEGSNLNGMNCEILGYLPSNNLFCNSPGTPNQCKFNKSNCVSLPDYCGDGIVQAGEQCEPRNSPIPTGAGNVTCRNISSSFTGGTLSCNSRCMLNTSSCAGPTSYSCGGDSTVGKGEQCEGTNVNGMTCRIINPDFFIRGNLRCTNCILNTSECISEPSCGDGIRHVSLDESCDGTDLGGLRCTNFSEYIGGTLGCNSASGSCTFNFDLCTPRQLSTCNNGVINPGEACDGIAMPDVSCPGTGTVTCADNCTLDYSDCDPPVNRCGNGVVNPGEQCEPPNTNIPYNTTNVKCHNLSDSFGVGTPTTSILKCDSHCMYNTSGCIGSSGGGCNDGSVVKGEQCEGTDIDGRTCSMINHYFTAGSLTCTRCMYNTSRCSSPASICGDGSVQKPNSQGKIEDCDETNLGSYTCDNFPGFRGGILSCANCNFDTSSCTPYVEPACNDGAIQPSRGEECDGSNLNGMNCTTLGFESGTLTCNSTCKFDTRQCRQFSEFCGNGVIDPCEQCDLGLIGSLTCQSFGFGIGVLSCTKNCTINTTACLGNRNGYCGNNILERGEQCDRGLEGSIGCSNFSTAFISGGVSCNVANCSSNTCECVIGERGPYCGDNVTNIELNEECDGTDLLGGSCQTLGYASGNLKCSRSCILNTSSCVQGTHCGDGYIQKPNFAGFIEDCDGTNTGGRTCAAEYGSRSTGKVNCTGTCLFDYRNCTNVPEPICGDNRRDRTLSEDCDGEDFAGQTCMTLGYDLGTLMCNAPNEANPCKFNRSDCKRDTNYCGDRIVQRGEQCDGGIGAVTCADFGFNAGQGSLTCFGCRYNTSRCVGPSGGWCGNTGNVMEIGEQCDATIKGDITCHDFGFMDGNLRCENCMINTSECNPPPLRGYCGDGVAQQPNGADMNEQCDLADHDGKICSSFSPAYTGGILGCLGDCSFDYSKCTGPPPRCGDGVRHPSLGEDCDLADLGTDTCLTFGYVGGNLTCNRTCDYNKSKCEEDPNLPRCGDPNVDKPNIRGTMEDCDGSNLDGKVCSSFSAYDGGVLSCDGDCTFDYTGCVLKNDFCGNLVVDPCEDCDMGNNGGIIPNNVMRCSNISSRFTAGISTSVLRCTSDCKFNTSGCVGVGGGVCSGVSGPVTVVNVGESCDGGVGSLTCTNISSAFNGGTLSCDTTTCKFNTCQCTVGEQPPVCGDGVPNQNSEECDKLNLNGETCVSLGYHTGILRCYDNCTLNKTACVPYPFTRCGDNLVQHPNSAGFNESCDNNSMGGFNCVSASLGVYDRGTLRCLGDCNFDFINCSGPVPPRCGDGVRHTALGEDCDGGQLGGSTCVSLGFDPGVLTCNSSCGFDKSGCPLISDRAVCGDGTVQKPNYAGRVEDCDGVNLNGVSCVNLDGFGGGDLSCSGDCTFNTLECWTIINRCGDGVVGPGEQCEGVAVNMSCADFGFAGGNLYCRNCRYNTSGCIGATGGRCGDGVVVRGEQCDGGVGGLQCVDVNSAFNGGALRCNSSCILDTNLCTVGPPQPVCGDGVRNRDDEECDVSDLGGKTCPSLGYDRGTLRCNAAGTANQCRLNTSGCVPGVETYCGDSSIQTPNGAGFNEQCDGTSLNGRTCTNFLGSEYTGGTLHCHTDCSYDYSSCTNIAPIRCGDDVKNRLVEDCDGSDFAGHTCVSQGFSGGTLSCTNDCKFDKSDCISAPTAYCGDGAVQKPNRVGVDEQCDGANLDGKTCIGLDDYTGGALRCLGDCTFDYSRCTGSVPRCSDGVKNQESEECDLTDLGGSTCTSLGYARGILRCTSGCRLDKSSCESLPNYCGDRVVQPGEQCDGSIGVVTCANFGFTSGSVYCNSNCTYNTRSCTGVTSGWCGDNILEVGEQCDGSVGSMSCSDFGFMSGSLRCVNCLINTSGCVAAPSRGYCGDGTVQQPNGVDVNESCDGSNINGKRCSNFDSYTGGTLACYGDCTFDFNSCNGGTLRCGDSVKNQLTEECDGSDLSAQTCRSFGYDHGTLRCYAAGTTNQCEFDKSLCVPGTTTYCGDNSVQTPNSAGFNEQCDGTNLNSRSCTSFGFRSGTLDCNGDCTFDYNRCTKCGDGVKNIEEECDSPDFGSTTCESLGYLTGTLKCTTGCKLDKISCIANPAARVCGDSSVQQPNDAGFNEQCDRSSLNNALCAALDEYTGGTLSCYGDCTFDHSRCTGGPGPVCGNDVKDAGEECDGSDLGGTTCSSLGYALGTVTCTSGCKLNKTSCLSVVNFCGDRVVESGEQCDGSVGTVSCSDFGFTSGSVSCTSRCAFDTSRCVGPTSGWCGDNILEVGEQCDGSVGSMSCSDFVFMSGSLRCASCAYNTSGCVAAPSRGYCGDGTVQQPNGVDVNESCDGSNINGKRCSNFDSYTGGTLVCRGDCIFDYSGCTGAPSARCGDGVANQLSEECDGVDLNGNSCNSLGYIRGILRCTSDCNLNKTNCVASPDPHCGDGAVQKPNSAGFSEQCDGTNLDSKICSDLDDYVGGALSCRGDCTFDYSRCTGVAARCGDSVINQLSEECDAIDLGGETCQSQGYASGSLTCTSSCKLDKTGCVSIINFCGDRIVESGEQCDGSLGNVTCDDFGFTSGSISCTNKCTYNTSRCTGPTGGYCGDGFVAVGEQCDGSVGLVNCRNFGLIDGALRCTGCLYNTTGCVTPPKKGYCGDGSVQLPNGAGFNELCDGTNLNGKQCTTLGMGFTSGTLNCANDCTFDYSGCNRCGDGIINQLSEECDSSDLTGQTCVSLGYASGTLRCTSGCKLDKSGCVPIVVTTAVCGDGTVQQPNDAGFNEQCDGTNLNSKICSSVGAYTGGTLRCRGDCTFDYSSCTGPAPRCGDNAKNQLSEECDGNDFNSHTCASLGYASGTLDCASGCTFDKSGCIPFVNFCGDRVVEPGEQCDGSIGGMVCSDFGFTSGSASCSQNCTYNTRTCVGPTGGYCGDNILEVGEQCDGSVGNVICRDFGFMSGTLRCNSCKYNTSECIPVPSRGYCGDIIIQQPNGAGTNESCDGTNLNSKRCTSFNIYSGGTLGCLGDCSFDYSSCTLSGTVSSCGDGSVQSPNDAGLVEQCDGSSLGGRVCSGFDSYTGGVLRCSGVCSFDYSGCTGAPVARCGDGVKNLLVEECDGSDLGSQSCVSLGYVSGTLSCTSGCRLNKVGCVPDIIPPTSSCGDGTIQTPNSAGFNEQCDGAALNSKVCSSFDSYTGGILHCSGICTFDYSECTGAPAPRCGDGVKNQLTEECDFSDFGGRSCESLGYTSGSLRCAGGCKLNKSNCVSSVDTRCGDNAVQKPNSANFMEQCDGSNLDSKVCSDFDDYTGGSLSCHGDCTLDYPGCTGAPAPRCGDNVKNQLSEECDNPDFSGETCQSLGYASGALRCTSGCKFDKSDCLSAVNFCGDRVVQPGEQCDGSVGGVTCSDFGFTSGVVSCNSGCTYNTSRCIGPTGGWCGDGTVAVGEQCDGSVGVVTCRNFGLIDGTLRCTACKYNTTSCTTPPRRGYCGDSLIQLPNEVGFMEQCDGSSLGGRTCISFSGYTGGTLACHGDCSYDYTSCTSTTTPRCGDGVKNLLVEDCDGTDLSGHTCKSQGYLSGTLSCTAGCKFDKSKCSSTPGTFCGDGVVQQPNNAGFTEDCDGSDLNGGSCVSLGYVGGVLRCSSGCAFVKSGCSNVTPTFCGDNIIQKPNSAGLNESCEGSNINNRVCTQFDNYLRGTLACHGDCSFNYDNCNSTIPPRCNDGAKNQYTEECDGTDFGVGTCLSLGFISGSLKCTSGTNGCKLDKSGCVPPLNFCGDRIVEPGEQCDGNLANTTCRSFGFTGGGYLSCKNCTYDTSACIGPAGGSCGDGTVVPSEQCDGSAASTVSCRTFSLWDGTVQCVNCKYNTSRCIAPSSQGYCGDGGVQKPNWVGFNEDCDGTNLNAKKCSDVGNYNAGTLKCNGDCTFDYTNCTSTRIVASCGDGAIQAPNSAGFNEQCDGININNRMCSSFSNYTSGALHCSGDCSFDYSSCTGITPKCGDGVKNLLSEECDGTDLGSQSCQALGYASGTLTCTTSCKLNKASCVLGPSSYCGDSSVQQPNSVGFVEQCDGSSLNARTCSSFSGYSGGVLACHGDCSYDYTGCTNIATLRCGDGTKNRLAEDCDAADLAGHTCKSQGYISGTLSCTAGCKFDKSKCSSAPTNSCGDSVVQQPNSLGVIEDCDGADLNGETCLSLGYLSGTLRCTTGCKFDKTGCVVVPNTTTSACGDGTIQAPNKVNFYEQCDGSNLNNLICSNFDSYSGGNLACYGDCSRDYRTCTGGTFNCGDGIRNNLSEECDGTDLAGQSCQTFGYISGTLSCTSGCKLNKASCVAAPTAYCGDGTIQAPNGANFNEQCDGTNLNSNSCDDFWDYTGGTLKCHTGCSYDYSKCTGAEPECGDSVKNQAVEECDAADFSGQTCKSLGYASGNLKCTNGCKLDKSSCVKGNGTYCGDSSVQKPNSVSFNEQCDNTNLNSKNCTDFDYSGGKLLCAGDCTFSYSNCTTVTKGLCGDGVKNGQELCDKNDWGIITGCTSFSSFKAGTLSCLIDNCHFDTTKCISLNSTVLPVNASCYDNQKDGEETDLDCGDSCFPCPDGNVCTQSNDCQSNNCKNNMCESANCEDGVKNGIETDADCGGNCPQCQPSQGCSIDSDCTSTFCNLDTLLCSIPACDDSFLNGDESDLDCGGGCPVKCSVGQQCRASYDCQSGSCEAGVCSQDRNLDSDDDGMPDFWEDKYGLNKNNPDDANEDMDGDDYANLQEFQTSSDPTDPESPQTPGKFKNHTLQIILLIIGILFMASGAGFLVYSRKVLIPQQKAAAQKKAFVPPPITQRPLLKRPLSKLTQLSQPTQPGSQQPSREKASPGRFVKKEGERKSLLDAFGKQKPGEKPEAPPGTKSESRSEAKPGAKPVIKLESTAKPSAESEKSDEFINISELGKQGEKTGQTQEAKTSDKKQPGDIFKRLKELSAPKKKK